MQTHHPFFPIIIIIVISITILFSQEIEKIPNKWWENVFNYWNNSCLAILFAWKKYDNFVVVVVDVDVYQIKLNRLSIRFIEIFSFFRSHMAEIIHRILLFSIVVVVVGKFSVNFFLEISQEMQFMQQKKNWKN